MLIPNKTITLKELNGAEIIKSWNKSKRNAEAAPPYEVLSHNNCKRNAKAAPP